MRIPRVLTTALLALATAVAVPAAPVSAAGDDYVALGDSYSSGTGAGDYSDALCTRSGNAYPALWAQASAPASFTFAACGGAKIPDVLNNQVRYLDASTSLVSISIGGNDSGFASIMLTCMFSSQATCEQRLDEAADYARTELPGELDALYATIRDRAPNAEVVVVGYPYLYKEGGFCLSMGSGKRAAINDGADVLNQVIAGRAAAAGFSFADARPAFAGHEICTSDPWISSSNIHPTAEGHEKGYLPAFSAAVS